MTLGLDTDSWSGSGFGLGSDAAKWQDPDSVNLDFINFLLWREMFFVHFVLFRVSILLLSIDFSHRSTLFVFISWSGFSNVKPCLWTPFVWHGTITTWLLKEKKYPERYSFKLLSSRRPSLLIDCVLTRTTIQYSWARRPWYRWCRKTPGNTTMTRHTPCR